MYECAGTRPRAHRLGVHGGRKRYSRKGRTELKELEAKLESVWATAEKHIDKIARDAGVYNIISARESGLLKVKSFDDSFLRMFSSSLPNADPTDWTFDYLSVAGASVSDASTYPLFDELISRTIRTGIAAGAFPLDDTGVKRAKETRLAAELFKRLPLFEEASIDEILDIRKELTRPLVRFRSAIINFTEEIKGAAWDEGFAFDAERLFNRDVAPAVLNIEDEVKANPYFRELVRKWFDKSLLLTGGSALALAVSNLPIPSIAALALGATANTIAAIYDTNKEWRAKQRTVEQNNMFFYYRAGEMLSK